MQTCIGGVLKGFYPESSITSIKRFKKGHINKTYELKVDGRSLVLRVYPKDFWKIKKEKYLYGLIRKETDVPVPEVIASGRNYLLMSKIEGKELSVKDKDLVRGAGELLAKIHAIRFPYYGWIINKEIKPRFRDWANFIDYDIDLKFRRIPNEHRQLKNKIRDIIERNRALLDVKSKPCLLHKDYHSPHIIVNKGKIGGIIDFEWAMSGHNEFDLAKSCLWMFDKKPKLERIFLEGYGRYGQISEEFDERNRLYKLIVILSSLSFSYECKHKKWCTYNLKKLKGAISEYNKNN